MDSIKPQGQSAGIDIGVMLLDNSLPRPRGDVGNAQTFDYPVAYDVIEDADTTRVIEENAVGLVENSISSARRLLKLGVRAIATCCGFLAIHQRALAEELNVPIATSSLMQIPLVIRTLRSDQKVAVVAVNASTLTTDHFHSAGLSHEDLQRITLVGLEDTAHFYPMIIGDLTELDTDTACAEIVDATAEAVAADPSIGAFVFECTNLPPYADAVRRATSRPVWDATALIAWLKMGVHEESEGES